MIFTWLVNKHDIQILVIIELGGIINMGTMSMYNMTGKYVRNNIITGYRLRNALTGEECKFTREQTLLLAGKGQILDIDAYIHSDKVIIAGKGIILDELPTFNDKPNEQSKLMAQINKYIEPIKLFQSGLLNSFYKLDSESKQGIKSGLENRIKFSPISIKVFENSDESINIANIKYTILPNSINGSINLIDIRGLFYVNCTVCCNNTVYKSKCLIFNSVTAYDTINAIWIWIIEHMSI